MSTFPKANPVTFVKSSTGTTIVNSASLDPKVIATMIQNRDQRKGRQKYVLRPEDCHELTNLYTVRSRNIKLFGALPIESSAAKHGRHQIYLQTNYKNEDGVSTGNSILFKMRFDRSTQAAQTKKKLYFLLFILAVISIIRFEPWTSPEKV